MLMSLLYSIIISPIELVIEVIFVIACRLFIHQGIAIIVVSLVINLLILPMYHHADILQEKEREKQKRMSATVKHIRKTFSGNERFMMLQTYYRQQNYKPAYALRGSVSLLLQIPFFIAAYHFLSGLTAIRGVSFLSIRDLGAPDGLISIGAYNINLLPILMTVINLLSGALYLRGAMIREKVQTILMALVFMVLLYPSPSVLVLYWTCNNLFSLFKNLLTRMRHRREAVCILTALSGALLLLLMRTGFFPTKFTVRIMAYVLILAGLIVFCLPLVQGKIRRKNNGHKSTNPPLPEKNLWYSYLSGCLLLTLLTGLMIPSALIAVSPSDFIDLGHYVDPLLNYIPHTLCVAAGCFLLWAQILYYFSGDAVKRTASLLMPLLSILALINYTFFGNHYGIISAELHYNHGMKPASKDILLNLLILTILFLLLFVVSKKRTRLITSVVTTLSVAVFLLSLLHVYRTESGLSGIDQMVEARRVHQPEDGKLFTLSSSGKNVIVILLDRAMGPWVPYIFEELPVLQEQFDGFCYYSNTLSHGAYTPFGSPGLYGGYEYTPANTALRSQVLLKDKHNEALMLMPLMFHREGFQVSVCDQPYGNYSFDAASDLSIYDDYPEITAVYPQETGDLDGERADRIRLIRRNFFCYGIMRSAPVFLHEILYWTGTYLSSDMSANYEFLFRKEYSILKNLPKYTEISDSPSNHYITLYNLAPHEYVELQMPFYEPVPNPDNSSFNTSVREAPGMEPLTLTSSQFLSYCTNAATYLRIGEWLDALREAGVYDNTRIILVADHGAYREIDYVTDGLDIYTGKFMPLLMVKDFNAKGFTVNRDFMTNADTPYLAMEGLLTDMRNPFTGNLISPSQKEPLQIIMHEASNLILIADYKNRTDFEVDGVRWYGVSGDISNPENWIRFDANPLVD